MKQKVRKASLDNNSIKNKQQKQDKRLLQNEENFEGVPKIDFVPCDNVGDKAVHSEKSGFEYFENNPPKYLYEFTNSKFLYYIGTLDSITYLVVITIIAIAISEGMNRTEREVIFGLFLDIGDAMETIVDQDTIRVELEDKRENDERNRALQTDFDHLNSEIDRLRAEVGRLKGRE